MKSETKIPFFLINRYLLRGNKWKIVLIVFLMAIAFINLIFVSSLFSGIIKMSNDQIVNAYTGNIMITPENGKDFIEDADEKTEAIAAIDGVKAVSTQLTLPASLQYNNIKGNWSVLAINPDEEKNVTNVSQKMIEGEYLDADDEDGIIIGRQIAGGKDVEMDAFSFKNAQVGQIINLSLNGISKDYIIRGIFYTKFINTDQRAFISKKSLESLIPDVFMDKTNSIIIKTDNKVDERVIIEKIKNIFSANYYSWEDVAGLMTSVTKSFSSINVLLYIVGMLIAAITIFVVVYIDILSKRQQIGILRAIGIKPYLIDSLYVMQTVVYSCFGVLLGAAIYFAIIVPYFNAYPFQLPIGDAKLSINYVELIFRAETIIFVAIAAGLVPTIIITRMKLLDAIWGK